MLRRIFASSPAFLRCTLPNRAPDQVKPELAAAIRRIIAEDRIVIFLTGTPQEPRCGFTVKMVDMMHQLGVKYSFYNILEDDEVCEGLKIYSDWPTYPQLYIDGDLVGGYDVCKGMLLSGQLTKLLKEKDLL
ncbi:monothiol glutaredoxin, putative [Trypanosoma equiperdum]|uniref:Monothiol glutaredoxin, putative n=5 Tax=Trypanozoon TaxID=39700 RepID=Q389T5_TRYB2|nr:monothiol glutaredoxin, putative [Trypanosoma brucei gambiense DAL972]XP_823263.1 monothiol glutaredoxin, putative [Trypanosoma brucei brucei TREU927]RHW69081.1 monothiol glutaredoxin [Trypanosoma brucei equiperdum]CAM31906.1 mono-cysteine glutaredoxin 2 precursor [Trypanosoma brucei brucei]SCU67830.1 monothiol glutaredoxin, putative [Trypanosoma equiperdum]EAN78435.1 monothiol glutaredoxin, putative [Trypanosoma brucei brucei TREU927]CBH16175.1 monothiol glutaredoxin, putative [Trypanosom|eukprot:XP_011778439.1 monothiol glutaredoxin, putative [Trypanosoma brucei gambiense DAL972]